MKKLNLAMYIALVCMLFISCKKEKGEETPEAEKPLETFSRYKTDNWRDLIGDTIEVEGFIKLNENGTAILFANEIDYYTNGLVPENRYIALGSEYIRALNKSDYYLSKVKLKGVIRETRDRNRTFQVRITGDQSLFEVGLVEQLTKISPPKPVPTIENFCLINPELCKIVVPAAPEKYALLYSGGYSMDKAYDRYWNDMSLYYNMLIYIFGYDPDNIIVVYKDGVAKENTMKVDFPASPEGIDEALMYLEEMMMPQDEFFFFMTNHGGTVADAGSPRVNDEPTGDKTDECTFYYNENTRPYDDDVKDWIDRLNFSRMICIMEQCYSGGMIYDLRGPNRVIITAANETEVSYGSAKFDDFVMLFASALIKTHQEKGNSVDADENKDGKVSLTEAFRWAVKNDPHKEHPQYEDSGDGISTGAPKDGNSGDGALGKSIFKL